MAPRSRPNSFAVSRGGGQPAHTEYRLRSSDGRIDAYNFLSGRVEYVLTLQLGFSWADFYDAYTKGGSDYAGEQNALQMVTKEPAPSRDAAPEPDPGSLQSGINARGSSWFGGGSSETGGEKKPGKSSKKKPTKKKGKKTPATPNPPDEDGSKADDRRLQEAKDRLDRTLEKLKDVIKKLDDAANDADGVFKRLEEVISRLKKQGFSTAEITRKLESLRRTYLQHAASKKKIQAARASSKNIRQILQQKWQPLLRSRNKNFQPDAPLGKDMKAGDPVNLVSGAFTVEHTDAALPGRTIPLAVTRSYSNQIYCRGSFGTKWTSWFDAHCRQMKSGAVYVWLGNGSGLWFMPDGKSGFEVPIGSSSRLLKVGSRFRLVNVEGCVQQFDGRGRIEKISDRFGNWIRVTRNEHGHVTSLRNSTARELNITGYPIRQVKDGTGRVWKYQYDRRDNLIQVTLPRTKKLPKGRSTFFEYENGSDPRTWSNLKRIRNTNGELALENLYGTEPATFNRVIEQEASGDSVSFQFIPLREAKDWGGVDDSLKGVSETTPKVINFNAAVYRGVFTDSRGLKTSHDFNEAGQPIESVHRAFTENAESLGRIEYDAIGNVEAVHQPAGNAVLFKRDVKNPDVLRCGNALEIRQHPRGNGAPLITKIKYGGDFNQPVEIQLPDGSVTRSTLNDLGLVERVLPPKVTLVSGTSVQSEKRLKWNSYGQPTQVIDAAGRAMRFSYYSSGNGAGLPKEQKLNGKTVAKFQYDANGRLIESSDISGITTEHEYDELDQVLKVSEPSILGTATRYEYNALGLVVNEAVRNLDEAGKVRSPEWIATLYRHDKKGRVISVEEMRTETESSVSKFVWDSEDNLIETRDALGSVARFEYDDRGQLVRTVSNPGLKRGGREVASKFEYDRNGNPTATVDSLGHRWTTEYDGHDRPLEMVDPVGNRVKLKWHGKADRVLSTRTTTKPGRLLGDERTEYDELGRVTSQRERVFAPDGKTLGWLDSSVVFDIAGQVVAMIDPLGNRTDLKYDKLGQLVWTRDSVGNVERTSYDDRGLVTSQTSELVDGISPAKRQVFVQRFGYDDLGRMRWQQDGLGNRSLLQWDGLGQLISRSAADGSAERFEYDLAGRMTRQVHSDKTTSSWRYDAGGRLLDMTNGRGQITRLSYDEWHDPVSANLPDGTLLFRHRYDAAGRVVDSTDARGVRIRTTFDALSQPTRQDISLRGNAEGVTQQNFTWDRWGNLRSATNGSHKVQLSSDSLGRPHKETVDGRSIGWTFGRNHLLDEVQYPDGFRLQHQFDQHGRLSALQPRWPGGGGIQVPSSGSAGPLAEIDWLGGMPQRHTYGNGMQTTSQLDAAGRRLSLSTRNKNGKTVEQIDTLRDAAGLVKGLLRGKLHATACEYDDTGQLVESREGSPIASPNVSGWLPSGSVAKPDAKKTQSELAALILSLDPGSSARETTNYEYDAAGNRKRVRRTKAGKTVSTNYSADTADRYSQIDGATQKYDAAGNLIDDGRYRFRYDGFSRLTRVTDSQTGRDVLTQSYDPLGRVTKRTADGTEDTMVWDGHDLIFTQSISGGQVGGTTSTRTFIPGLAIDQPLAEMDSQGTHYLHPDPTSSVVAVSNSQGDITERFHYSPFGERSGTFDASFKPTLAFSNSRARFQGREQLGSLPYLDFRSRAYSPRHGRFLQTDPIGLAGDSNQYRFALNNPLSFMDPMGTDPVGTGGGGGFFDPNADLFKESYLRRGASGMAMDFFESLLMVGVPFLGLAATLGQLDARARAGNRSGTRTVDTYSQEMFDLAKLIPIFGGVLGLGELAAHKIQGRRMPHNLSAKILGALVGGAILGTGGSVFSMLGRLAQGGPGGFRLRLQELRMNMYSGTPTVGGYGHAFKHAAFLNRLRAKAGARVKRKIELIRRAQELVSKNLSEPSRLSPLDILPRAASAGGDIPHSMYAVSFALDINSVFQRLVAALKERKVPYLLDASRSGSVLGMYTHVGSPSLGGIVTVFAHGLAAAGETLGEFTRRIVGVMAHESWHARQSIDFARVANRLDELLARITQYQVQNPQGYRHKGQVRLDAKPSGFWILDHGGVGETERQPGLWKESCRGRQRLIKKIISMARRRRCFCVSTASSLPAGQVGCCHCFS